MTDPVAHLVASLNSQEPQELWAALRLKLMTTNEGFPAQALGMAMLAQDKLVDFWLADLQAFADEPALIGDGDVLHMHLVVLLAARRDRRAFAPLLQLCRMSDEQSDEYLGDFASSVAGRALASLMSDDDVQTLLDFADEPSTSVWLRAAALNALCVRALAGEADRQQTGALLLAWGEREAARQRQAAGAGGEQQGEILSMLTSDLCSLAYVEAEATIKRWFEGGLIDKFLYKNMAEVREDMRRDYAESVQSLRDGGLLYIEDACAEMRDWAMFSEDADDAGKHQLSDAALAADQPFLRDAPKIGRNDPCPCGSGKKFKKCCGAE